jgi:LPS-assembly protein
MKNKIISLIIYLLCFNSLFAENLNIQSLKINIDKNTKLTIFEKEVVATDHINNVLKTDYAEYRKDRKLLKSTGKTTILTSEGYFISGNDMIFDQINNLIKSNKPATIRDLENNKIYLEKFEYSTINKFFKSNGDTRVVDSKDNSYNFSQIYVDEIKKEIIGSDVKAFLNEESLKVNVKNKPRVFANTVKIKNNQSEFTKSVFTLCDYRKNDKCPPWSLQASQMSHDKIKKTIYYDNAVIKIYNLPIFYTPKLSHPDPTVNRRSGFLPPTYSDTKNLGSGLTVPYYWAINEDRDLTVTSKLFVSEKPLYLGEYRQAFEKSNLIMDFGYTGGYEKTNNKKKAGDKFHFFSKYVKNFKVNESDNNFELSVQNVSNNKYLKLYKIKSNLVEYETNTLENTFNFTHENDNLFLGFKASAHETLNDSYNDKFEYILPDLILDKNLFNNVKFGSADFQSNLIFHNYDTNKSTSFLVNDIDWNYKTKYFSNGLKGNILGKLKNVNYETKNVDTYKDKPTQELFGALGYLTQVDLFKETKNKTNHFLTPKMLLRYAPGHMRKNKESVARVNKLNIFSLDRLNEYNNFENGLSTTIGFDYKKLNNNNELNFSLGQIINEKENKDMPSTTSLDEKLSDVIGATNFKINEKIGLEYNFALDQNYKDINYNDIGASFTTDPVKFNFSYLQEKEHLGNQEYLKTNLEISRNDSGVFSFNTKRNLITNSAEYYNLSYEYLNDCLRAGLVYRREFYNDSELESENSLMFKITLTPFGNINSPSFNK